MDLKNILIITRKELRDAMHNRWLLLYSISFTGLASAIGWLALSEASAYGSVGFGRTAASLINLIILIVPLMGLTLGALSMAGERERGSLLYILSQPISKSEIIAGKYIGLSLALMGTLVLGFGISGLLIYIQGGGVQVADYTLLIGITFLLALITLSLGFFLSSLTNKSSTATGLALFTWLLLIFLTDLGLMGTALVLKLQAKEIFLLTLINPLQVFKITSILVLRSNLEVLGPGGIYAIRSYGENLFSILITIMLFLIILPILVANIIEVSREDT
jgi:Cu-processing system permease protein